MAWTCLQQFVCLLVSTVEQIQNTVWKLKRKVGDVLRHVEQSDELERRGGGGGINYLRVSQ